MKRTLLCGLTLVLVAGAALASDGRSLRTTVPAALAPTLLGQTSGAALPVLSPVPDPAFTQYPSSGTNSPAYIPGTTNSPAYLPSPSTSPAYTPGMTTSPSFAPGNSTSVYGPPPGYIASAQPIELFRDVRYHGSRNIAPCAVPTIVQIPDPCVKDRCCKTCVNVQICVPPCDAACIKVTRGGNKVCYDYGKYSVVVKTVGHHVVVSYDD